MCKHETKICGRCNVSFECKVGNIAQCQCNGIQLTDDDRKYLSATYTDCLCRACLLAVKNEVKLLPEFEKRDRLQDLSKAR